MELLVTPNEAARMMGVSHQSVRAWIKRIHDPLPSIVVGSSGRNRKVIVSEIAPWLAAEAARKANTLK